MKLYSFLYLGIVAFCFSVPQLCFSQQRRIADCGTRTPLTPYIIPVDADHAQRNMVPIMMKIFVHIIANDNGTNQACGDSSILRQLENMQEFYASHSICFQLLGIEIINDSDLNIHNTDTEEFDLGPYIVAQTMNIFVHWDLFNNEEDLNGNAYGIPNTYLSVSRAAMTSIANRSTLSHEMGHCFGLYHTFETSFGEEEIPRNGECRNCEDAGDFLCDTKADPHSDTYDTADFINSSCIYFGELDRECEDVDYEYDMDPHNIMAYGRRSCRDLFTNGQGARMNVIIPLTSSLVNKISPSTVVMNENSNTTINTGTFAHGAENYITVQGDDYVVTGDANGYFNAPSITVKPRVHFNPGAGGSCTIQVQNPTCD